MAVGTFKSGTKFPGRHSPLVRANSSDDTESSSQAISDGDRTQMERSQRGKRPRHSPSPRRHSLSPSSERSPTVQPVKKARLDTEATEATDPSAPMTVGLFQSMLAKYLSTLRPKPAKGPPSLLPKTTQAPKSTAKVQIKKADKVKDLKSIPK